MSSIDIQSTPLGETVAGEYPCLRRQRKLVRLLLLVATPSKASCAACCRRAYSRPLVLPIPLYQRLVTSTRNSLSVIRLGFTPNQATLFISKHTEVTTKNYKIFHVNREVDAISTACPFCYIMLDDGVKGAGKDESEIKVGDIAIHLLDAIENGERSIASQSAPLAAANVAASTTSFS